jgi:HEAT repeat protein
MSDGQSTGQNPEIERLAKEIVKHLALTLRNVRSYPPGHPFVTKSLNETDELLKRALEGKNEVVMVLFENSLMIEGFKVDKAEVPAAIGLSKDLARTEIRSVTFTKNIGTQDILLLLQVLAMDKLTLAEAGGAMVAFKKTGTKAIGLNEVEYGIISRRGGPSEQKTATDWDSFIRSLRTSGSSMPASPDQIVELLLAEEADPSATDGETAYANVEKLANSMFDLYGDDKKKEFAKWFASFVAGVVPALEDKIKDKKTFESKMASLIRKNLSGLSDAELVDTMMDAATKKGTAQGEDVATEARAFLEALSVKEDKRDDLLEKLQERLMQDAHGGGGGGQIMSEDMVVTSRESLSKLQQKVSGTLGTEDVDALIAPFMKTLEDPSPQVRKMGAESLGEMLLGLVQKERYALAEKSIMILKRKMEAEENFEVYVAYVSVLEKIARKLREADKKEIAEKIQVAFTEQISSEQKRKRAVEALGQVGGTDALISLLSALWESGIYKEVRDAIVHMGKEAMPLVMEIFGQAEDKILRRRIIDLLVNMGPGCIPFMMDASKDERWFVRRDVATVLSNFEDPGAARILANLTKDKEYTVREVALEAISKTAVPEAEDALIEAVKDPNKKQRDIAVRALVRLPTEKSAAAIASLALESTDEEFQKEICTTLGQMGLKSAIEPLAKLLEETAFMGRPKHPEAVRVNALFALAKIGGESAKAVIQKATNDKSRPVQIAAQSALRRMSVEGEKADA